MPRLENPSGHAPVLIDCTRFYVFNIELKGTEVLINLKVICVCDAVALVISVRITYVTITLPVLLLWSYQQSTRQSQFLLF